MEAIISADFLTAFDKDKKAAVDKLLQKEITQQNRKVVVLDDDPTGVQTVHGVGVYTDWSPTSLQSGFAEENNMFFLLTNSRGFTQEETQKAHAEIIANTTQAAKNSNRDFIIVSRGDSTLRGHYPLETQILRTGLEEGCGYQVDGEIICPYFAEGGRFTINDIHYVRTGDQLIPAAQTEFAKDKTFGYAHSNLRDYIAEKTSGEYKADEVISVSIDDLRKLNFEAITQQLLQAKNFCKIIVNATDDYDLKVFCVALYRALAAGKHFCYRTAAAFVKAVGGIASKPLLTRGQMITGNSVAGGIVVVGSHTQKTTAQLKELLGLSTVVPIEMNSDLVLVEGAFQKEVSRIVKQCEKYIQNGKTPVVYTKRTLLRVQGDTPEAALLRSVQISDAVQSIVGNLRVVPSFVLAKGGITSSDIGIKALGVKRAMVMGQIRPGIPVWQTDEDSLFKDMPYVIFPGNVGESSTLREAVEILTEKQETKNKK